MTDNWNDLVDRLFTEARAIPTSERTAFLEKNCKGDAALREEVESLLKNISADFMPPTARPRRRPRVPGYRVIAFLDKGGMGDVWLAEQEHTVLKHKVALKVIHRGMDTDELVVRFETERQALAMMDHPNISRVFDAGASESGRPYFAMEYVKGLKITEHCDQMRLDIHRRLELFAEVCDGVQHAHQRAVIHRDLKPSNVLVATKGDRAIPKIIDFGIAKVLGRKLTEESLLTDSGRLMGTPAYMSPEQADAAGHDIDTRTDIYSLGVLLYELLTGTLPIDHRNIGLEELRRKIRVEEPPKPSSRLSSLADRTTDIADGRRTNPSTLGRSLRGELDWIAMKALEKEPSRRYSSASEFAADVRRHLAGEPVMAGPPSATYHLRKFVGRHRASVIAGTMVLMSLLVLIVVSSVFAIRAREAEHEAREAEAAAVEEANTTRGLAEFWGLIARDERPRAENVLRHCIEAREPIHGVWCRVGLGWLRQGEGDRAGAERLFLQAIEAWEAQGSPAGPEVADAFALLGRIRAEQAKFEESRELFERALEVRERAPSVSPHDVSLNLYLLAKMYVTAGELEIAVSYYQRALAIDREAFGDNDPFVTDTVKRHAAFVRSQGHDSAADRLLEELSANPVDTNP